MFSFNVQFQNRYRVRPSCPVYHRVLLTIDETFGAIGATADCYGNLMSRSYCMDKIRKNSQILENSKCEGNKTISFAFSTEIFEPAIDMLTKTYSKNDLEVFRKIIDSNLKNALSIHEDKIERCLDSKTYEKFFDDEYPYRIRDKISWLQRLFLEIFDRGNFPVEDKPDDPTILELGEFSQGRGTVDPDDDRYRTMMLCLDAGGYPNLTRGMLYRFLSESDGYIKIEDDFGVAREFRRNRFANVSVRKTDEEIKKQEEEKMKRFESREKSEYEKKVPVPCF